MNSPTNPLPDDVVDELLSADLDGDFDRAARDHGLAPPTARALIDGTPGSAARRAALAAARDTIAVEALTADQRALLLAQARTALGRDDLETRRARRVPRRWAAIAAAAAAVAVVTALGASLALIRGDDNDDGRAASKRTATESAAPDDTTTHAGDSVAAQYDFGHASNREELRANVEAVLPRAVPQSALDAQSNAARTAAPPSSTPSAAGGAVPQQFASSDACVASSAAAVAGGVAVVARGPITYAGTAAEVLVFAEGDHFRVLVVDDAEHRCARLADEVVNARP